MVIKPAFKTDIPLPVDLDLEQLLRSVSEASQAILAIYDKPQSQWKIREKADESPVTEADKLSDDILRDSFKQSMGWPADSIISEESTINLSGGLRRLTKGEACVLIDPLDGTKEFIKRSGQFVINIGIVLGHEPVFGLIHVPVTGETVMGWKGLSNRQGVVLAWDAAKRSFQTQARTSLRAPEKWLESGGTESALSRLKVLVSGSAPSEGRTTRLSEILMKAGLDSRFVPMGSALKFLRVADGIGDVYIRRAQTAIWDTAAGQAIVESAGGVMLALLETGPAPFRYVGKRVENSSFVCFRPEFPVSTANALLNSLPEFKTT